MHELLLPFEGLIGTWRGEGRGEYPTIEAFGYLEQVELQPAGPKPILVYTSTTEALDDGRPLHAETGYLRALPGGEAELVVAHAFGVVEVTSGSMVNGLLTLLSDATPRTSTAKPVDEVQRRYEAFPDALTYVIAMAAVDQPLTDHLTARLERVRPSRPRTQRRPGR